MTRPPDPLPAGTAPAPPNGPGGIVVLFSGGIDSAVMTGLAAVSGVVTRPLYVRQGFVWEDEECAMAARFLASLAGEGRNVRPLAEARMTVPAGYASRWALDADAAIPDADSPDEAVYLPGRNLALLTQGAIHAAATGATEIHLGVLAANPFPDATEEFFRAFESAAAAGLEQTIRVRTPLASMDKTEVLLCGARFDLSLTLTCIRPRAGRHCGACNKCAERRRACSRAGLPDPADYSAGG